MLCDAELQSTWGKEEDKLEPRSTIRDDPHKIRNLLHTLCGSIP